jgi:adenylate cyclase class IV
VREVELKGVVPDLSALRARLKAAHAVPGFRGTLCDVRYDMPERTLLARDHVLRVRTYRDTDGHARTTLDWKGPTRNVDGYKVREEQSTSVGGAAAIEGILTALGYVVIREIDRETEEYTLNGALMRVEQYPRLDVLLEVEGAPEAIESAIAQTGISRSAFTAERLPAFVARFESRTGLRAALSAREMSGDLRYRSET